MSKQKDPEESQGVVDATSVLYILGGIPAIVAYCVIVFLLTRWIGIPA
jgi:hypothetical protein